MKTGGGKKKKCQYYRRALLDKVPKEICYKCEENTSKVSEWDKCAKAKREEKVAAKE